jgi:hypothetical protein
MLCLLANTAGAQLCQKWKEAVHVGDLQVQLQEASGVAASRVFPGRLYHINDSGSAGNLYITGMAGENTTAVNIAGVRPLDTEGMSLGRCPDSRAACLYIGDIGDNNKTRQSVEVAVIEEMRNFPSTIIPKRRMKFTYPDGPHDAESIAVDPKGTIFILTKERPARLFQAEPKQTVLKPVTTLDPGSPPTDMAISDDGTRLLVLTYTDAVEYSIDFKEQHKIRLNFLQQQESVTYLPGSRSFIYSTERLLPGLPQWIMRVDCE